MANFEIMKVVVDADGFFHRSEPVLVSAESLKGALEQTCIIHDTRGFSLKVMDDGKDEGVLVSGIGGEVWAHDAIFTSDADGDEISILVSRAD